MWWLVRERINVTKEALQPRFWWKPRKAFYINSVSVKEMVAVRGKGAMPGRKCASVISAHDRSVREKQQLSGCPWYGSTAASTFPLSRLKGWSWTARLLYGVVTDTLHTRQMKASFTRGTRSFQVPPALSLPGREMKCQAEYTCSYGSPPHMNGDPVLQNAS